jgi:hypothetical protein
MIKTIWDWISCFWCFGGGFVLSVMCFILSWKLSLSVFCLWLCTWIIIALITIFRYQERETNRKQK